MRSCFFVLFCAAVARSCVASIAAAADGHRHRHRHRHHHGHRRHHHAAADTDGSIPESLPLSLAHQQTALRHGANQQQADTWAHISDARRGQKRHVAASVDKKAVNQAVDTKAVDQRPIITGCLKECGYEEQACVTQCQVCIEQNECRILGQCDPCLKQAHDQMERAKKMDKGILDLGGVAMMRDGLMAEMSSARLDALDRKRKLRFAREGVLKMQREAEWAAQERHLTAKNLVEASQDLKRERQEVTRWKLQNEKKLKAMRAKAREHRQERQKAERKLSAAKRKYNKAQRRLRIASDVNETQPGSPSPADEGEDGDEEEEEVWRLAREVEDRKQAVKRAEDDVEKTSADGDWLDRGLQRRVKGSQSRARKSREELLVSRARERVSREHLDDAKKRYIAAVQASRLADKAAEDSEIRLRKAPVSPHPPPANTTDDAKKDKPLHNLAPLGCAGNPWLQLLAFVTLSVALGA